MVISAAEYSSKNGTRIYLILSCHINTESNVAVHSGKAKELCDFAFFAWKILVLGLIFAGKMPAITYLLNQNLKCILCGDIDLTRFAENEHHGDRTQKYFIGQKYLLSNSAAAVLTHTHHTLATLTRPKIPKDADNGLSNFLLSLLKPKQDQQGS